MGWKAVLVRREGVGWTDHFKKATREGSDSRYFLQRTSVVFKREGSERWAWVQLLMYMYILAYEHV